MIKLSFNSQRVQGNLRQTALKAPTEFGRALYQESEIEATECKRRTPVAMGELKNSIHVEGPTIEGREISTKIVAGGVAAPYAVYVHENLEAFHPVGEAKFIERPLYESRQFMGARVARRIDLNNMK